MDVITPMIVAILTLMAWSMLYRESSFYSFAESLLIGLGMGYMLYITIVTLDGTLVTPLAGGKWSLIIPAIGGLLLFASFSSRFRFLSRWGSAAIVGSGLGFVVSRAVPVQILGQVSQFYLSFSNVDAASVVNWLIVTVTAITTIMYFTFTIPQKGLQGTIAKIGRWSMMVAFGATFGATIVGDLTYVIERSIFLSSYPQVYLLILAAIIIIVDIMMRRKK
jgi:hypothetical protein